MKGNDNPFINSQIKVLILSDRLCDRAKEMAEYFRLTKIVDVAGIAANRQQALNIAQDKSFDYLIIAGYLRDESSYEVISELQEQQKKFLTVQWAMLDSLIAGFCKRYKIPLKFDRTLPMSELVNFLMVNRTC
ncbi:MAG: hypothetical protein PHV71_06250 [Eubacteriales bacterium]|nr:hypothetical protein [Eubacteriales bacterium]MDD3199734.1 hypothetical protein [Eubacteriales bacterium]MDD4121327.1 hypothetical protein [Eubacteriales bacterium]MDD4630172.1 hypothetical protein [Eubacteriales bacterium]